MIGTRDPYLKFIWHSMPRYSLNSWPGKIDAVLAEQELEWNSFA